MAVGDPYPWIQPWKPWEPMVPTTPIVPYVPTKTTTGTATITVKPKSDKSRELAINVLRSALTEVEDLFDKERREAIRLALSVLEDN